MKRWPLVLFLAIALGGAAWLATRRSAPPEVPFDKARRETLVSLLSTNGKVEPADWRAVHPDREGRVARLHAERGQHVAAGAPLVTLADPGAEAETASAMSRLEAARAALAAVERGGAAREVAEFEGSIEKLKVDLAAAAREVESLRRLVKQQAATRQELLEAEDRARRLEAERASLERRRASLVERDDRAVALARVRQAQEELALARRKSELSVLRAPFGGVVYDLAAREGAWVTPRDTVARVGRVEQLRVIIYVDEPDLGRVRAGQTARISWDALPGKQWQAAIEMAPTQVVALGTRQVGEVVARAANPDGTLPPGANINAEIRASVVENALTIPKEALRRSGGETGVYLLDSTTIVWRRIVTGESSVTRTEVREGLAEGDAVALPVEGTLRAGMAVTPVFR